MSQRLDIALVQRGLAPSRERARMAVAQGLVTINGAPASKVAQLVGESDVVVVSEPPLRYVSRGGLKLEKAIREFGISLEGALVLDIGASTGGFTDCALQHGARHVTAIDVGSGQLAASLRDHPQVLSLEKTDVRELSVATLPFGPVDWIVMDLSFISLEYVFPLLAPFLKPDGKVLALVKPQFELGAKMRLKNGIVKDEKLQRQALEQVKTAAQAHGFHLALQTATDADGIQRNKEYLALFHRLH